MTKSTGVIPVTANGGPVGVVATLTVSAGSPGATTAAEPRVVAAKLSP